MNIQTDSSHSSGELSTEPEHNPDRTRDHAKSEDCSARTAVVRGGTVSKLLLAWKAQREAIDKRYRRQAKLMGGLFTLFAALFTFALFLAYRQAMIGQTEVSSEVSEIHQELARFTGGETVAEQTLEKLDRLTFYLGVIASSLEKPGKDGEQGVRAPPAESASRDETEAALASTVRHLVVEQKRFSEDLESLRSTLKTTLERHVAEIPTAAGTSSAPEMVSEGPEVAESAPADAVKAEDSEAQGPAGRESSAGASGSDETLIAPEGRYALQLIGFFSRASLSKFVAREQLPTRVYSIRETYKGQPWYTLIHSLHENSATAREALSRLPADLVALDPWIRHLSGNVELQIIETQPQSN